MAQRLFSKLICAKEERMAQPSWYFSFDDSYIYEVTWLTLKLFPT